MPWCQGDNPVRSALRAGLQLGVELYALEKRTPSAAMESRFGVLMTRFPAQPRQSPRCWSVIRYRMFGFTLAVAAGTRLSPSTHADVVQAATRRKLRRVNP